MREKRTGASVLEIASDDPLLVRRFEVPGDLLRNRLERSGLANELSRAEALAGPEDPW